MRPIWKYREVNALSRPIGYIAEKGEWRSQMFDTEEILQRHLAHRNIVGAETLSVHVAPDHKIVTRRVKMRTDKEILTRIEEVENRIEKLGREKTAHGKNARNLPHGMPAQRESEIMWSTCGECIARAQREIYTLNWVLDMGGKTNEA